MESGELDEHKGMPTIPLYSVRPAHRVKFGELRKALSRAVKSCSGEEPNRGHLSAARSYIVDEGVGALIEPTEIMDRRIIPIGIEASSRAEKTLVLPQVR
jgi:hypothetical protein